MNSAADDAARRLSITREAVAVGLAAMEVVGNAARDQVSISDDIDVSTAICSVSVAALTGLDAQLTSASAAGHRITATIGLSGSELEVSWTPGGPVIVDSTGEAGELVRQRDADAFARATARGDALTALSLVSEEYAGVVCVVKSPENGANWVRTRDFLVDQLRDGRWASTLAQLVPRDHSERVPVVLIQDAQDALLCAPGLLLAGPQAVLPTELTTRQRTLIASYRARAAYRPRPEIFTPAELTFANLPTGFLSPLAYAVASTARAAAWYWLADDVAVEPDRVTVGFTGVSSLRFELIPYGAGTPTSEVALTDWATASGEPSRADAVQQAISFAVRSPADLAGAAEPVLRTARSLYELAGRGLISEALAARRASRDSAVTAARAAASTARDVATKAVERTLALVIAASVALFANSQKFVSNGTSYAIILALAAIAAAALLVALLVDTRSGSGVLKAFDLDVEQYRDTLSEDDIQATKNLRALTNAHDDLRRARRAACIVYGAVIATVAIGGSIVIASQQTAPAPAPVPTGSTAAPQSSSVH